MALAAPSNRVGLSSISNLSHVCVGSAINTCAGFAPSLLFWAGAMNWSEKRWFLTVGELPAPSGSFTSLGCVLTKSPEKRPDIAAERLLF